MISGVESSIGPEYAYTRCAITLAYGRENTWEIQTVISATPEYGLLLRKKSLSEKAVPLADFAVAMKGVEQVGEDAHLISYGPCFGPEALDEYVRRLQKIGLEYWDDFVEFSGDYPSWCRFSVRYAGDSATS